MTQATTRRRSTGAGARHPAPRPRFCPGGTDRAGRSRSRTGCSIEGPPEADALVPLVADPDLVPPVALLAYRNDTPAEAAFWPFAVFSPEWQALSWSARHEVPVGVHGPAGGELLADRRT